MAESTAPVVLWRPTQTRIDQSALERFKRWLADHKQLSFDGFEPLWEWSANEPEAFWESVWQYFGIQSETPYTRVMSSRVMPGVRWFEGAEINFTTYMLRHRNEPTPAIIYDSESYGSGEIGWSELVDQVGAFAATLRSLGVSRGDRVCAFLPSTPHAVIAFLAVASLGAIWSIAAPEMGVSNILNRFEQVEPTLLIACNGYINGGRTFARLNESQQLIDALPSLRAVINVALLDAPVADARGHASLTWDEAITTPAELVVEAVPFDHPLWILYSSGTTGLPKAIVHSHGGVLLNQLLSLDVHMDMRAGDRVLWTVSTGWMVWNVQICGLLMGATICLYDGNAAGTDLEKPDWNTMWRYVADKKVTTFGSGAAFHIGCMKRGLTPGRDFDLSSLTSVGSTGSPLSPEAYRWLYSEVKEDMWLCCVSGGTDICGGFINGSPALPVYLGEMQCRNLGVPTYAFNEAGEAVYDEVGELICTGPIPSMPLFLWGDRDQSRYRESYFEDFFDSHGNPYWRHGDWLKLIKREESVTAIIYGRSDSTINRHGIRMGTAEIYDPVEALPEIADSLVIDLEYLGRESRLLLFVQLQEGVTLDDALESKINETIRTHASSRMIPNEIHAVPVVPRNLTGKKLEVPIRKMLLGQPLEKVMTRDVLAVEHSIDWFIDYAAKQA